ncbi:hypothetical protein [Thermoanaerobacterium sp. DL9XJH110]|uniref:hypothetical protein n=1 Tax=Thermoanaerobacterium sp. DL9XJH110 TaxID=3386643 RepID=UPI003BB7C4E5
MQLNKLQKNGDKFILNYQNEMTLEELMKYKRRLEYNLQAYNEQVIKIQDYCKRLKNELDNINTILQENPSK